MQLITENKNGSKIYNVKFYNLTDLYDYLKNNPTVNTEIFKECASSDNTNMTFYGASLEKSIEYIMGGYNNGLDNFLITSNRLQTANVDVSDNRKIKRGLYGGIPLSPLLASNVPDCMLRYERESSEIVRNIYFSLGYPFKTYASQIINRGLATIYIIDSLEKKGQMINFKANEVSYNEYSHIDSTKEIVNIEILLKKPGDIFFDIEKCFFPMVGKEFLRRILFRVLESVPVTFNDWGKNYGHSFSSAEVAQLLNLSKNDMIIPSPSEIGIKGYNIYEDTIQMIDYLKLTDEFDIEKIKYINKKYNL